MCMCVSDVQCSRKEWSTGMRRMMRTDESGLLQLTHVSPAANSGVQSNILFLGHLSLSLSLLSPALSLPSCHVCPVSMERKERESQIESRSHVDR